MEVFIFILFAICGYLLYRQAKLERRLKEQDSAHKKALVDAGNAITETLRVAFDNLKKNSSDHSKINSKITEHMGRIHRLEQHIGKAARDFEERDTGTNSEPTLNKIRKKEKSI